MLVPDGRHADRLPRDRPEKSYRIHLHRGQYLHLLVEQLGTDLVATIEDAEGRLLLRVDRPGGFQEPEELFLVARTAGDHVLTVAGWDASAAGRPYEVRVEALRPATPEDRQRAAAAAAFSRACLLAPQEAAAAAVHYQESARIWREMGDAGREAQALDRLGRLLYQSFRDAPRLRAGVQALSRAFDLYGRIQDRHQAAHLLYHLGRAWTQLGEVERAGRCYEAAAALWDELGNPSERAARLNDLAIVRVRQGRLLAALDLYSEAVAAFEKQDADKYLATTLTNAGEVYALLGEDRQARGSYRRALRLLEREQDPHQRAITLNKLGDVLLEVEGPDAALPLYDEALELRRQQGDPHGEAVTLNSIGLAQLAAQRPREALGGFTRALEIFRQHGDVADRTAVLSNLGLARERLGHPGQAREPYRQALELARASGYLPSQEAALFGLARVERLEGRLGEAERWMEQALAVVETTRRQASRSDLKSSYDAARQEMYGFFIDLLAERHRREPARGHDARAFAIGERARARSFAELLAAARRKADPEVIRRLDILSRQINARHRQLLDGERPEASAIEAALTGLLDSYQQEEARLPEEAAPPIATLEEAQALLDGETLLLAYSLGERRSFLWAVTPSAARFVATLPGRADIEDAARRAHAGMTESHLETGEAAAKMESARLSRMLLGPVADLLRGQRLVIVAPGALQLVPFAALPFPEDDAREPRPLIADHEIVSLPSVSVLATLRAQREERRPPAGLLAVVADPVFDPDDVRLHGRAAAASAASPAPLRRLAYAGREAEAILALAGGEPVLAATGFAADRELLKSGRLGDYRILHFATHGLYNDLLPELSALALSTFDAAGRPVDGYLRAYEVFDLELRADLVVLSACRTALVGGPGDQGLMGLTEGFLHAGASRIVVSLWDVSDEATEQLMRRFYAALLRDQLPPAQALRRAQLDLQREDRWRAPSYWAGFVLRGDWR